MADAKQGQKDAYELILEAIDTGVYEPGDRLVESELAERFGVSRTPIREALQRLETQSLLARDGRSLIVASLSHNQLAELYVVRSELEGLAASLAAQHATPEEIRVLRDMVEDDRTRLSDPAALSRSNRRFHKTVALGVAQSVFGAAIRPCPSHYGSFGDHVPRSGGSQRSRGSRT